MLYSATGIEELDQELSKHLGAEPIYYSKALLEGDCSKGDVVIISPHLQGEITLDELIPQLRKKEVRVIFLAGDEIVWVKKYVQYGLFDYIFGAVDYTIILDRINHPMTYGDVAKLVPVLPLEVQPEDSKPPTKFPKIFKQKDARPTVKPVAEKDMTPELVKEDEHNVSPKSPVRKRPGDIFTRYGYIVEGRFVKHKWSSPDEVFEVSADALVLPPWKISDIKAIKRDVRMRATPIIVLGGMEYSKVADRTVKKINRQIIDEVMQMSNRLKTLWQDAETDPLTGLYTRRFVDAWLDTQQNYTLVLIDLDHFKRINDTYGHDAGDIILKALSDFLKTNLRTSDLLARWGGEEFLIGLGYCNPEEAFEIIDRIRFGWGQRVIRLPSGKSLTITFSAGIGQNMKEADTNLYKAKEGGRNRVCGSNSVVYDEQVVWVYNAKVADVPGMKMLCQTSPPEQYDWVVTSKDYVDSVPKTKPVLVLGAGLNLFGQNNIIPVVDEQSAVKILSSKTRRKTTVVPERKQSLAAGFYSGAQGGQGKTVLTINTAALLARSGKKVCIIDLDTEKCGLTLLCGFSESNLPVGNLKSMVEKGQSGITKGPAGIDLIPMPVNCPGWFPLPKQIEDIIASIAQEYDYVFLDFGAKVASPSVIAALKKCDRVFLVATPFRAAVSAISRFRSRELIEISEEKIALILNRAGAEGAMSPRDVSALLGLNIYTTVSDNKAFPHAENQIGGGKWYRPPVLERSEIKHDFEMIIENLSKGGQA